MNLHLSLFFTLLPFVSALWKQPKKRFTFFSIFLQSQTLTVTLGKDRDELCSNRGDTKETAPFTFLKSMEEEEEEEEEEALLEESQFLPSLIHISETSTKCVTLEKVFLFITKRIAACGSKYEISCNCDHQNRKQDVSSASFYWMFSVVKTHQTTVGVMILKNTTHCLGWEPKSGTSTFKASFPLSSTVQFGTVPLAAAHQVRVGGG